MAIRLARAGMHLLIEKPLSTSLDGIDELQAAIAERQRVAMVAYVYRSIPVVVDAKRAIDSGRFGKPMHLVVTCGQHFPTYRPAYREIYYTNRATGGGAIQDALTHMINTGEWLVGSVDRIAAVAAHQVLEGVDVEDTVNVITRQGDVLGSYALNQFQSPNEIVLTVHCERGSVRIESHVPRWRWMTEPGGEWNDVDFEPMERDTAFAIQATAFLDAVEGKAEPRCTLDEGVQTLRVNLAALRAADEGTWQQIERTPANRKDAP